MLKSQKQKEKKRELEIFLDFLKILFPSPTLLLGAGREKKGVASHDLGAFILVIPAAKGTVLPWRWMLPQTGVTHSGQKSIPAPTYLFPEDICWVFFPFQKVCFGLGFFLFDFCCCCFFFK